MNICSLGRKFLGATQIDFSSTRTLLEYDAAFIDLEGLVHPNVPHPEAMEFRRADFAEFLSLGRTIVVFIFPLQLNLFLPVEDVVLKEVSGNRPDFKGSDYLKTFWESVKADMQFFAFFEPALGKPFLFVSATNKPVGSLVKHDRGNLLLLPWLHRHDHYPDYKATCDRFIAAFIELNQHLVPKKQAVSLPAWSAHYGWERERDLRKDLVELQVQSDQITNNIKTKTTELEIEDKLKILFTGKGDSLVDTVIDVLKELGAKANNGEPGRDDVIIEFEGKHAVIEVKGKKGSAAEADAAQLEKWVAGFKEEKGTDPKGILLIDAYCETPLAARTEPPFPHQMLKYSTQREHCLMTTTQLLGLLLEARTHPKKRIELVDSLFSTVGVYKQFSDWRAFLIAPTPSDSEKTK